LSIVLNEHFEEDGELVFSTACQLGCGGHRLEAAWLALPLWAFAALGEGQKSECASGKA
jgi:mannose/cellobiose epimerase-like protein (N-acyl-D-glucosamine 2-epimerase family)